MVKKEIDWKNVFGAPDASFNARFDRTLQQLQEEKPMKRFTVRTFALACALLIVLCAAAYALTGGWGVGDYLANRYGRDIPEDFKSEYAQTLTQTVGGVTFTIRDAYVDHNDLYAIVTLARADGENALFLAADLSPEDTMSNHYLDGREDERTIGQYAAENDLSVQYVNLWFEQNDEYFGDGMDMWLEEDGTTAMALIVPDIKVENGAASLKWCVLASDEEDREAMTRGDIDINLPAVPQTETIIEIGKPVEGLALTLDKATFYTGALGTRVEIAFSVPDTATEEELAYVRDCVWFELIDPAPGERVPEGAALTGYISDAGDRALRQIGDSISASWQGDTLVFRAFDCWEKTRYGSVEVKIK